MFNRTIGEHTQALADYLPNGRLFEAKNVQDSNFRQLLRGLAGELFNAQGYLVTLGDEYFPDETNLFLSEWERALGIPDCCFAGDGDVTERRRDVLVKLSALGVQTADDFVELAAVFGVVVTVTQLSQIAFPPYSVPFIPTLLSQARFTIVVLGQDIATGVPPYDVPFDIIKGESVLECLFRRQAPANCTVLFINT